MTDAPLAIGAAVALVAILGATVAVCLGKIDGSSYVAIVSGLGGFGLGGGAHAAGVKQGQP